MQQNLFAGVIYKTFYIIPLQFKMKKKKDGKLKEELMKKGTSKEMEWYLHFHQSIILKKKKWNKKRDVGGGFETIYHEADSWIYAN